MRKRSLQNILFIFFVTSMIVIQGCSSDETENRCIPPPERFNEKDLIGTWRHGLPQAEDQIIIREDGYYKQIIHYEGLDGSFDYESDWQSWWLEFREDGIPYLHLVGMRMCIIWILQDCEMVGVGDGLVDDFCHDELVHLPSNEGVLMVHGMYEDSEGNSKGIALVPFAIHETVGYYSFVEP
jgi:hypothetical protein